MRLPFFSKKTITLVTVSLSVLLSALSMLYFVRLRSERAMARSAVVRAGARMSGFPKLFLWAWERPEQLDFINPGEVGVAFLSKTIYLREDRIIQRPRMQPLHAPAGVVLMAVVRIEIVRDAPTAFSKEQREQIVAALLEDARAPRVSALQIDFDALESERSFYKSLLQELRSRMLPSMPLSITALTSWCINDNWLDGLPIDEAVPMLFRMGVDEHRIRIFLKEGGAFRSPLCRSSVGISMDEPVKFLPRGARTYVFNPQSWASRSVNRAIERSRE